MDKTRSGADTVSTNAERPQLSPAELVTRRGVRENIEGALEVNALDRAKEQVAGSANVVNEDIGNALSPVSLPGAVDKRLLLAAVAATVLPGCEVWDDISGVASTAADYPWVTVPLLAVVGVLGLRYGRKALQGMLRLTGAVQIPAGHYMLSEKAFSMFGSVSEADRRASLRAEWGSQWKWYLTRQPTLVNPNLPREAQIFKPEIETVPANGDFEQTQPVGGVTAKLKWSLVKELTDPRAAHLNMRPALTKEAAAATFDPIARDASLKAITNFIATLTDPATGAPLPPEVLSRHITWINEQLVNTPEVQQFEAQFGWRITIQLAAIEYGDAIQKAFDEARSAAARQQVAQAEGQQRIIAAQAARDAMVAQADGAMQVGQRLGPDAAQLAFMSGMPANVVQPMAQAWGYGIAGRGIGQGFGEMAMQGLAAWHGMQNPPAARPVGNPLDPDADPTTPVAAPAGPRPAPGNPGGFPIL